MNRAVLIPSINDKTSKEETVSRMVETEELSERLL